MSRSAKIPKYSHRGIVISIYQTGDRFSAQFLVGTERHRIERGHEFQALEAAKREIDDLVRFNESSTSESVENIFRKWKLSPVQAACLLDRVLSKLEPTGVSLEEATEVAVKQASAEKIMVSKVVELYLDIKSHDSGYRHNLDLRCRLGNQFVGAFGARLIRDITGPELAAWIDNLKGTRRSRRNYHSALVGLFRFAQERGFVQADQKTAIERVKKPIAEKPRRVVLLPDELSAFIWAGLKTKSEALVPLLIQCFAGVRSEELCQMDPKKDRLRWSDIHLDDEPEIEVRSEVSKVGEERFVFINPTLASWLRRFRPDSDQPIYAGSRLWYAYRKIAKAAGQPWKKNAPRKSFNTYHAALSGSLDQTSGEAGNSEAMIRRYYRKEMRRVATTAREWFSLTPEKFFENQTEI